MLRGISIWFITVAIRTLVVVVVVFVIVTDFIVIMLVITINHMRRDIMMKDTRNNLNANHTTEEASDGNVCCRTSIEASILQVLLRTWKHTIQ